MPRDINSFIQAQTTVTGNGTSAWFATANNRPFIGAPSIGVDVRIDINAAAGDPGVLFEIEGSPDQSEVFPDAKDPYGSTDTVGVRFIRPQNIYPWMRLKWTFGVSNPTDSSSSSSSSVAPSMSFSACLSPTKSA